MNFTYSYLYDVDNELLNGNITWFIPNFNDLSHWIHAEDVCKFSFILYALVLELLDLFQMKEFTIRILLILTMTIGRF